MNIKRLRKSGNLSQQDLADKLGAHRTTVAKWEIGESTPSAEIFDKMAKVFGVDVVEFFVAEGFDKEQRRTREIQDCFLEVMEYTRNKLMEDLQRSQDQSAIDHFNEGIMKVSSPPPDRKAE